VRTERKYGQPFAFTAWSTMIFSANEIPGSSDGSAGWTERWVILPFPTYIGDRVDPTLEPRMQAPGELAGVAATAVGALRGLMARGAFTATDSGRAAHAEFVRKSNPVRAWLDERTKGDGWVRRVVAYENYRAWVEDSGLRPLSRPKFYDRLRQAGVLETKRQGEPGLAVGITEGRGALPL
jgi:putative DNA primase/helicase